MDFNELCKDVEAEYGLAPGQLEAGSFSVPQWQVLYPLAEKLQETENAEDWRRYLEQKAKFITGQ